MMDAVERYLRLRRLTGFAMSNAEYLLASFARFAAERDETLIRAQTAIDWAAQGPSAAQRDARLKAVCRFARHVCAEDDRHELPPANYFGWRKKRRLPYIYAKGEIDRLIEAATQLRPRGALRPHTYATLLALLASTGLRISEALGLRFADITADGLLIREISYAYSFQLLFKFAAARLKVKPSSLALEQLDSEMVSAFLEDLEDTRRNAPETRNVRLAAIKSFFHFLEYQHPASLEQIRRVLAIPYKRTNTRLVPYLVREEVQALLDAPDPTTRDGIRDRAMLHLAVCAGLRVSELVGLRLNDISLPSMSIRVYGKGRRERALPLWKSTTTALRAWLAVRGTLAAPEVFVNLRGQPMSRWGVAYMLKQHAKTAGQRCPGLLGKKLSPHVLRHTCAMIVLQATQDIRKVSLWLGHSNLATTEIYTRGDPTEKLEAIEAIVPPHLRKGSFRPPDRLVALLKAKP